MSEFQHYSVMLNECVEGLAIRKDGLYVDCTAGGGGHSLAIASRLDPTLGGRLIAIDQDPDAIEAAGKRLAPVSDAVTLVRSNFSAIREVLSEHAPGRQPSGVLIDLGISSYQIDTPERGFSYMHDAPLDMRMDPSSPISAQDLIDTLSEQELTRILFEYGEERFASRIARAIVARRDSDPVTTTLQLAELTRSCIPKGSVERGSHPAKRTFQALRIAVNHEPAIIPPTVKALTDHLAPGGRLVILTFHSLEDRLVKQAIAAEAKGCTCPSDFPICVCGKKPRLKAVSRKPLLPSAEELRENPRSHSAKLRIAERL